MKLRQKEKGFTIIEVLIVLAIAGLIMVIVFLAVPALQRNARNTSRTNDASRILAAVNECLSNRNGKLSSCDDFVAPPTGTKAGKYILISENQQLTTDTGGPSINAFQFFTDKKCNTDGSAVDSGTTNRAFAVVFQVETTGAPDTRCIGS